MDIKTLGVTALLSAAALSNITYATVPNTFADGEPAVAAEVNENFTNLDDRATTLETKLVNSSSVDVNCVSDSINAAITNASPVGDLTVNILGACTETVVVTRSNTSLVGAAGASIAFDQVASHSEFPILRGVINVIGAQNVVIDSLSLSGASYDGATGDGVDGKGVLITHGASASVKNSSVTANASGIIVSSAVVRLSNNTVSSIGYGVIATDGGTAYLTGGNNITQNGVAGSTTVALSAYRSGTINISGANTITAIPSVLTNNSAIEAYYGSQIRVFYGLLTVNGNSSTGYESHINLRDVNHTGNISIYTRGTVRLQHRNSNQTSTGVTITGDVSVGNFGIFTSNSNTTLDGNLTCGGFNAYASTSGTVTGIKVGANCY